MILYMDGFDDMDIDYARSFARTSNVFCNDIDFWTRNDPIQIIKGLLVING